VMFEKLEKFRGGSVLIHYAVVKQQGSRKRLALLYEKGSQ